MLYWHLMFDNKIDNFGIEEIITECSYSDDTICLSKYIVELYEKDTGEKVEDVVNMSSYVAESDTNDKDKGKGKSGEDVTCDSQICILDYLESKDLITKEQKEKEELNIKPEGPADSKEWLSDNDLKNVFMRYRLIHEKFCFFAYQMLDFAKFDTKFSRADYTKLLDKFDTFGCIINTDKWSKEGRGIHWFATFIDARVFDESYVDKLGNKPHDVTIEYFNSSGHYPYIEIIEWQGKVKEQIEQYISKHDELKSRNIKVNFINVSKSQIQKDNHSCGVYSLFYIYYRLKGVPYTEFNNSNLHDKKMTKFRQFLFRKED
jgi:hypothetical protein